MEGGLLSRLVVVSLLGAVILLWAQGGPMGPPGPKPPPPDPARHIADVRRRLDSVKAIDVTAERALAYSHEFLVSAEKSLRSGEPFKADRFAAAADSLLHVAEHQQHLRTGDEVKGPPPPRPAPDAPAIQDHLQRVYFRTQQAGYFLSQAHDPRATPFPGWARDFYQLAVRDYERKDFVAADENAKSSDDVVRALENLAQAASSRDPKQP